MTNNQPILELQNVTRHYPITKGVIFSKDVGAVKAVDGVSFQIQSGETFGLVGESGCGKTTTAKLILRLENPTSGQIPLKGQDVTRLDKKELSNYRAKVQAVFQDPASSLNPRMRVKNIVAEPLVINSSKHDQDIQARVQWAIDEVGLRPEAARYYPHEFSGDQRQRIAIARSLVLKPELILLDEPVSALDVSIRAQIMNLLQDIQGELGISFLLIAHDLAVVKHMSRRIGVNVSRPDCGNC